MKEVIYAGFISYSYKDREFTRKLHQRLKIYRIPGRVAPDYGQPTRLFARRLGLFFRSEEETAAGDSITATVADALVRSRSLIVVCSPHSAASPWVSNEIREYQRLFHGRNVYAVIAWGDDLDATLPTALRSSTDLIAADFRPSADGENLGFSKLVAGLLKVKPEDLIRSERRARIWRRTRNGALAAGFAGLAALSVLFGFQAAENQRTAFDRENAELATLAMRAVDEGKPELALRLALAGHILSPHNEAIYRSALAAAMFELRNRVRQSQLSQFEAVGTLVRPVTSLRSSAFALIQPDPRTEGASTLLFPGDGRHRPVRIAGHTRLPQAIGPDGSLLLIADQRNNQAVLRVLRTRDAFVACSAPLGNQYINSTAFLPDGRVLVAVQSGIFLIDPAQCASSMLRPARNGIASMQAVVGSDVLIDDDAGLHLISDAGSTARQDVNLGSRDVAARVFHERYLALDVGPSPSQQGESRIYDLATHTSLELVIPSEAFPAPTYPGETFRHTVHDIKVAADGSIMAASDIGLVAFTDRGRFLGVIMRSPGMARTVFASPFGNRFAIIGENEIRIVAPTTSTTAFRALQVPSQSVVNRDAETAMFSPDGRLFFAQIAGRILVWDVATGRRLPDLHHSSGNNLRISPGANGLRLIGVSDTHVYAWDLREHLPFAGTTYIGGARMTSANGSRLFTVTPNGGLRLWDVATHRMLNEYRVEGGRPWPIHFSPDGRYAILTFNDRDFYAPAMPADYVSQLGNEPLAFLVDLQQGRVIRPLGGPGRIISSAAFSAGSDRYAFVDAAGRIEIWSVQGERASGDYRIDLAREPGPIVATLRADLTFSGSGRFLAVSAQAEGQSAVLIDLPTHQTHPLGQYIHLGQDGEGELAWIVNERRFDLISLPDREVIASRMVDRERFSQYYVSPNLGTVLLGGLSEPPRIFPTRNGQASGIPLEISGVRAAHFTHDSEFVAADIAGAIGVYRTDTGALANRFNIGLGQYRDFQLFGHIAGVAMEDGTYAFFDADTGLPLRSIPTSGGWASIIGERDRAQLLISQQDILSGDPRLNLTHLVSLNALAAPWSALAADACRILQDAGATRFSPEEISGFNRIRANWTADREVC